MFWEVCRCVEKGGNGESRGQYDANRCPLPTRVVITLRVAYRYEYECKQAIRH